MGINIFLFFCNLIIPIIMLIAGYFMYKSPPKSINRFYGYRTSMSMKNKDTWDFAHRYCGKLWLYVGLVLSAFTVVIQIIILFVSAEAIGIATIVLEVGQLAILLGSIFFVERALRRNFDKHGNRKL